MSGNSLTLHIEIQQERGILKFEEITKILDEYIAKQEELILEVAIHDVILPNQIKCVRFCSTVEGKFKVNVAKEPLHKIYHIYQVWSDGPQIDCLEDENCQVPASLNWCLPNAAFEGLWESLILEEGVKEQLMSYVQTTLLYSGKKVDAQVVHWNGVVLLHGPPGTGKTSLCKALAQKLSIRLNSKYLTSQLIEINTHSLFSKWFSESAKLVLKMFSSVKQWLQSEDHFVCILIDEVESLTYIRKATGTEPSDSIRVVNAVLTQIDQLQHYPNVLILATSNVTGTIDAAFADRADLKLFVPHPSKFGIYEILRTCICELIRCNLIEGNVNDFFEAVIFKKLSTSDRKSDGDSMTEVMKKSEQLMNVARMCIGFSGRTLRKIPFLTSTKFVNSAIPSVDKFLEAMIFVIEKHKIDQGKFLGE